MKKIVLDIQDIKWPVPLADAPSSGKFEFTVDDDFDPNDDKNETAVAKMIDERMDDEYGYSPLDYTWAPVQPKENRTAYEQVADALADAGHEVELQDDGTLVAYLNGGQTVHIVLDVLPEV